jgi:hypothetical protein
MDLALSRSDFEFMGRKDGAAFDTLMVGEVPFDVDHLMDASGHEQLVPDSPGESEDEALQAESFDLSFDWTAASSSMPPSHHQKPSAGSTLVEGDLFSFGAGEELGEGVNWDLINSSHMLPHSPTLSPTSVMNIPGISLPGTTIGGASTSSSSTAAHRKPASRKPTKATAGGSATGRSRTSSKSSKATRKPRPTKDEKDGRVPGSRPASPAKAAKKTKQGPLAGVIGLAPPLAKDGASESEGPQLGPDGLPLKKIGAYTLEQRKLRIARYHAKRKRRVWEKRIKYDCRKKLADSRPRVKGRFVKRTPEELAAEAAAKAAAKAAAAQARAEAKAAKKAAAAAAALGHLPLPPAKRQATELAMAELRVPVC